MGLLSRHEKNFDVDCGGAALQRPRLGKPGQVDSALRYLPGHRWKTSGTRRRVQQYGRQSSEDFQRQAVRSIARKTRPGTHHHRHPDSHLYLIESETRVDALRHRCQLRSGFTLARAVADHGKAEWSRIVVRAAARDDRAPAPICRASWPADPAIRSAPAPCNHRQYRYRIHGTNAPENHRAGGFVRLLPLGHINDDVIDSFHDGSLVRHPRSSVRQDFDQIRK